MGFVRSDESKKMEIEELKRMLVACAAVHRRKDEEEFKGARNNINNVPKEIGGDGEEKLVCVTSGVSFLGLALVNCLLLRGYAVRILIDHRDREELRELMRRTCSNSVSVVTAKLTEVDDLTAAFEGCRGVFHTSALADPAGLSGYSKSMAEVEVRTTENVMKACARASSVRNCVLTSSLSACIWRDGPLQDLSSPVINHESWSDESLCIDKKLWYALGKLKSEKNAWKLAEENDFKLATICPGLVTGPDFIQRNSTATIAYLKGAQEMYADGLLATVDVTRLAEAHLCVYEAMNKTAFGRYICFDRVIASEDEAENLAKEMGMPASKICGNAHDHIPCPFELSNRKLTSLMSSTLGRCYIESLNE